ncbi:CU044_5270 family protein [Streptomyces sp. NPDC088812]|uniref:CU044_5270 family protein n=1 Tax=Streptomyces sp. NPDC088812 TaxID=3365905 RepID=UPI00380AFCBA
MDDLKAVEQWRDRTPALTDAARAGARDRLHRAMAREAGPVPREPALSRRLVLRGSLAGGAAAALAAVTVVVASGGSGIRNRTEPTAAQVLLAAATATRAEDGKLPVPRDDQLFYTRTRAVRTPVGGGKTQTWTNESWLSVDGSRPSRRVEYGKVHNDPPLGDHEVQSLPTTYTALERLPTDPRKLLAMFRFGGETGNSDIMAFTHLGLLMRGPRVMPPGLQAAAFEALAALPETTLDHDVLIDGRTGLGVSYPTVSFTLVFAPGTYGYLGLRLEGTHAKKTDGEWQSVDPYYETQSLRRIAVVDRIGQRA